MATTNPRYFRDNNLLLQSYHDPYFPCNFTDVFYGSPPDNDTMPVVRDVDNMDSDDSNISSDTRSFDLLRPLLDSEFPLYFTGRGSPLRLFHLRGTYGLPADGDELKRQRAQDFILRMIVRNDYGAPIRWLLSTEPKGHRKVVDLCTGYGHWVLQMAKEFPQVKFHGLDLVPIQTPHPPPNVLFELADVTTALPFQDASVDIVHARMTCINAEAVPLLLQEIARILRPGGFLLFSEWLLRPALEFGHPWSTNPGVYMPRTYSFYGTLSNSDLVSTFASDLPQLISQIGSFGSPVSKHWPVPISTPYYAPDSNLTTSEMLIRQFIPRVMTEISKKFADAVVAGGQFPRAVADGYKDELDEKRGICAIYQTTWASKK